MKLGRSRLKSQRSLSRRFLLQVEQLESRELPAAMLSINDATVTEPTSGTADAVFNVSLSGASSVPVTVRYSTAGLTAQYGVDYDLKAASFTDNFQSGPGNNWQTNVGSVSIAAGKLTGTSARVNIASLPNFIQADVQIEGSYDLGPNTLYAAFLARYGGSGDTNFYQGIVYSNGGVFTAAIYKKIGGTFTLLGSNTNNVPGNGTLRFEVQGSSLRLYINNEQRVAATDSSLQTGRVGVRVGEGSFVRGPFVANQIVAPPMFGDDFNRADGGLGPNWGNRDGSVLIASQAATGAGNDLATIASPYTDVELRASYNLTSTLQQAGLVARYQGSDFKTNNVGYHGSGDVNMYLGVIHAPDGVYKASIFRNFANSWVSLASVSNVPASGDMRFVVRGTSLQLFVGDSIVVSAFDTNLHVGGAGMRLRIGGSMDNFEAMPLTDSPYLDSFDRPDSPSLGNDYVDIVGDMQIQGNKVIGVGVGPSLSINTKTSSADVSAEADLTVGTTGYQYGGLALRYRGPGYTNTYLGQVINNNGIWTATIHRNVLDAWLQLNSVSIDALPAGSRIRFDAVGSSLNLYINGELRVTATDNEIRGSAHAGLKVSPNSTIDNFTITPLSVSQENTLLFEPGVTTRSIVTKVYGDNVIEPTKKFLVQLYGATNADIADGIGVGTINDGGGDPPAPPPSVYNPTPPGGSYIVTPDNLRTDQLQAAGALTISHVLPAYQSEIAPVVLSYNSAAADPRPVFLARYTVGTTAPATVEAKLTFNNVLQQDIFYNTTGQANQTLQFALQADAHALIPTGRYSYSIQLIPSFGQTVTYSGMVTVIDGQGSEFGEGWSLDGLHRLHILPSQGVILNQGRGLSLWFVDNLDGTFQSPAGDFSTLAYDSLSQTYTRTMPDGVKIKFDSTGRQIEVKDRNSNVTQFTYNANGLASIIDPNGRITSFEYNGGSRVQVIRDPANRVTQLSYNGIQLVAATDPDSDGVGGVNPFVTSFGYDAGTGRMTSQIDTRGFTTTFGYTSLGKLTTVTRPDTTLEQFKSVQEFGLIDPATGQGTQGNPAPATLAADVVAEYTDPRTNKWKTELDNLGMGLPVRMKNPLATPSNPIAHATTIGRDSQGRVIFIMDGMGRTSNYTYDQVTPRPGPKSMTLPDGAQYDYIYNSFNQVTRITEPDPDGAGPRARPATRLDYDAFGNMTRYIAAGEPAPGYRYQYDTQGRLEKSTEPGGFETVFSYNTFDQLTQITNPDTTTVAMTYDVNGNLATRRDENNKTTKMEYDNLNRLTKAFRADNDVDFSDNPFDQYAYDPANNLISVKTPDPDGPSNPTLSPAETTMVFSNMNRLTTITSPDPDGTGGSQLPSVTTIGYDAAGNRISVQSPDNRRWEATYCICGALLETREGEGTALNTHYDYVYDDSCLLIQTTGPVRKREDEQSTLPGGAGLDTFYGYDANGRLTSITDSADRAQFMAYDADGEMVLQAWGNTSGGFADSQISEFDAQHRALKTITPTGNVMATRYDPRGNVAITEDGLGRPTFFSYDRRGRQNTILSPDPDGTGPALRPLTSFGYDLAGNRTTVTDPLGRVTTTAYDAQNRVTSVESPDPDQVGSGVEPTKVSYVYDLASRLTSVSDQVNTTTYVYDDKSRVKQVNHPVGGNTQYFYNQSDEVNKIIDRKGQRRDFAYNGLGQLKTETWFNGAGSPIRTFTWTHDTAGNLDNVVEMDNTTQTQLSKYAYAYDVANRVTSIDNAGTQGVPAVTLSYSYDEQDNRRTMTDNLSTPHTTTYNYVLNRLDNMVVTNPATVATVKFDYDSIGRVETIDRSVPSETAPIRTAYTYDGLDRLTRIKHTREITPTPTLLSQFDYTFDIANQIVGYGSTSPSPSPINESVSYVYDKTGQLTQAQGVRNGVNFTETYTFDRNGNRTMAGYQTGTNNRLMNDGTYSYDYDLDGNVQTKSKAGEYTTYVWDYRNRLTDILVRATPTGPVTKSAHYVYDADDRRIGVSEDADGEGPGAAVQKWIVYDGANAYADFTGSSLQKRYLYGPAMDEIYGRIGTNELPEWYLTDYLGSVRQIVNSAGGVLDAINYKSFGQIDSETAPAGGDRFKFTAREWDDMWAQYYDRARYYGPDVGRFRSEDPIRFAGGDANLYRYVGNGPTNATDPSGLQAGVPGPRITGGDWCIGGFGGPPPGWGTPTMPQPTLFPGPNPFRPMAPRPPMQQDEPKIYQWTLPSPRTAHLLVNDQFQAPGPTGFFLRLTSGPFRLTPLRLFRVAVEEGVQPPRLDRFASLRPNEGLEFPASAAPAINEWFSESVKRLLSQGQIPGAGDTNRAWESFREFLRQNGISVPIRPAPDPQLR